MLFLPHRMNRKRIIWMIRPWEDEENLDLLKIEFHFAEYFCYHRRKKPLARISFTEGIPCYPS